MSEIPGTFAVLLLAMAIVGSTRWAPRFWGPERPPVRVFLLSAAAFGMLAVGLYLDLAWPVGTTAFGLGVLVALVATMVAFHAVEAGRQ